MPVRMEQFVQCLANPFYLQSLAQQGLFDSEPFLNYLSYLTYFRRPAYARFLQYPQALHHLALLTAPAAAGEAFRRALKEDGLLAQEMAGRQIAHWAGWREREGAAGVGGGANGVEKAEGAGGAPAQTVVPAA
ncbi:suppressor of hpr1 [Rhodotorula kratochvilovae]